MNKWPTLGLEINIMLQSITNFFSGKNGPSTISDHINITPNSDIVELTKKFDRLVDRWSGICDYHILTSIIDLMDKIIAEGNHYKLLPFLEEKKILSEYLCRDFEDFISRKYDEVIINILFNLHERCGTDANDAIRKQCKSILSALEGFNLRRVNDIHFKMISDNRNSYCSIVDRSSLHAYVQSLAMKKSMPNAELGFLLSILVCYHTCLPQDFVDDLEKSKNSKGNELNDYKHINYKVLHTILNGELSYRDDLKTIGNIRRAIPGPWSDYLLIKYLDNIRTVTEFYRLLLEHIHGDYNLEEYPEDYNIMTFINVIVENRSDKAWRWNHILTSNSFSVDELRPLAKMLTKEHMIKFLESPIYDVIEWPSELYHIFCEALYESQDSDYVFINIWNITFPELMIAVDDTLKDVLDTWYSNNPLNTILTLTKEFSHRCAYEQIRELYIGYMYKLFWNVDEVDLTSIGLDQNPSNKLIWSVVLNKLEGVNESAIQKIVTNENYVSLVTLLPRDHILRAFQKSLLNRSLTVLEYLNILNRAIIWIKENNISIELPIVDHAIVDHPISYLSLLSRKIKTDYDRYHQHKELRDFLSQYGLKFDSDPILNKIVGHQERPIKIKDGYIIGFRMSEIIWSDSQRFLLVQGNENLIMVDNKGYKIWSACIGHYEHGYKWAIVRDQRVYTANSSGKGTIYDLETGERLAKVNKMGDSVTTIIPDIDRRWKVIDKSGIRIVEEGDFYQETKKYYDGSEYQETYLSFNEISKISLDIPFNGRIHICGNYIAIIQGFMSTRKRLIAVYSLVDGTIVEIPKNIENYFFDNDHIFIMSGDKLHLLAPDGSHSIFNFGESPTNISINNSFLMITIEKNYKKYFKLFSLNHGKSLLTLIYTADIPDGGKYIYSYNVEDEFIIIHSMKNYLRVDCTSIINKLDIPQKQGYTSSIIGCHRNYVLVSYYS